MVKKYFILPLFTPPTQKEKEEEKEEEEEEHNAAAHYYPKLPDERRPPEPTVMEQGDPKVQKHENDATFAWIVGVLSEQLLKLLECGTIGLTSKEIRRHIQPRTAALDKVHEDGAILEYTKALVKAGYPVQKRVIQSPHIRFDLSLASTEIATMHAHYVTLSKLRRKDRAPQDCLNLNPQTFFFQHLLRDVDGGEGDANRAWHLLRNDIDVSPHSLGILQDAGEIFAEHGEHCEQQYRLAEEAMRVIEMCPWVD